MAVTPPPADRSIGLRADRSLDLTADRPLGLTADPSGGLTAAQGEPPSEAVGPLLRGVAVLRALGAADGRRPVGDLARATGLARSTVDRVTATLARMGCVRLDAHTATLAPRLMELGNAFLAALHVPGPLGPLAERLADELDESVSLAVPDGDGIRFVHQSTRRRAMSLSFRIGDLLPAERTAPGALFAAEWTEEQWARWRERRTADPLDRGFPAVPERPESAADGAQLASVSKEFEERAAEAGDAGLAVDDQLIEPGLIALALPVRDPRGRTVCALSVVSHTSRHSAAALRRSLLPGARRTVAAMERLLREPATPRPRPESGLADWTTASKQELGSGFVESLARGLTVLTAFDEGRDALSLSAVAEATGLARATARRALLTYKHLGLVQRDDRAFRLTPRVLDLGHAPLSRSTLPDIASPHLATLVRAVHDSASLAVLDGDAVRYTARVATSRIMSVHITIGSRLPAYPTSLGRVLLAGLPEAERAALLDGAELRALTPHTVTERAALDALLSEVSVAQHALVDEELEEGLRSLAVPVRDASGRVVAAVNVAMHSSRRTVAEVRGEVLPALRAAVSRIEADLHIAGRFSQIPLT
ncbi:IclR family transcriptional regulator domain-containing protein [Streptomyces cavernicola]|uniref:IclR family transcriptional regulator C-terminal domain-containing protein n=1 Tax=Streptomyces cavernicola TaxID=3043613 RepID=A0ABT6SLX3_9ACTN|nr:IclR family transcriptional regulator C-terminal domain-containing protein [Streptomyces sp. B-S-A6]MDI3409187.1 IclR family transcriptional regulator C-terminal domain-containing protein [Streptomyces sp. B-S-A6]